MTVVSRMIGFHRASSGAMSSGRAGRIWFTADLSRLGGWPDTLTRIAAGEKRKRTGVCPIRFTIRSGG
ncbi:hypothetical protein NBRC116586_13030 [Pseudooceanicola nitratireducens]